MTDKLQRARKLITLFRKFYHDDGVGIGKDHIQVEDETFSDYAPNFNDWILVDHTRNCSPEDDYEIRYYFPNEDFYVSSLITVGKTIHLFGENFKEVAVNPYTLRGPKLSEHS